MAEVTTTETAPVNGKPAVPSNADLIAELEALESKPKTEAKTEEKKPEPKAETKAKPDVDDDDEDLADLDDDDDADVDLDDDEDDDKPAKSTDPDTNKRLEMVKRAERKSREAIARDRAQLQQEIAKAKADLKAELEAEKAKLAERARRDIAGHLRDLGISDDDFEFNAKQLYRYSKEAAADPKNKEAAAMAMREREFGSKLDRALKEIEELKTGLKSKDEQVAVQKNVDTYIDKVVKVVGDKTPLAQAKLEKNATKARAAMYDIADRLYKEDGGVTPKPGRVLKEYELQLRREAREMGFDPKARAKAKAETAAATTTEKKPDLKATARPLSNAELADELSRLS